MTDESNPANVPRDTSDSTKRSDKARNEPAPVGDDPALPSATPEKPSRKSKGQDESAQSYQSADSTPISLEAVDPKYHQLARQVVQNPKRFNGQLIMLVDVPLNQVLANAFQPPPLKQCGRLGFLTCFAQDRTDGSKLYVILYIRVSSRGQAVKGKALASTLKWMLKKCAKHGLTVAGVAVDIESGREEDRTALTLVMDAIQRGVSRCIVVPAISRLERSEAHFGVRMEALAAMESWVYYGQTYEDPHFEFVHWNDFDSRDRAVTQVRAAEKYVQDGIDGVANVDRDKLEDCYLIAVNKRDTFAIYQIREEDPERPAAKRKIIRPEDAIQVYTDIKTAVFTAVRSKDANALDAIVTAQSQRTGKTITVDDLWWELAVGWPIGINRRSPHSEDGLSAECEDLIVEEDVDAYWQLIEAFAELQALNRRQRAKTMLASDALDHVLQGKMVEAQEERDDSIRFHLCCNCTEPPTPVKWVGDGPGREGMPQDYVICPKCHAGGSGAKGKRLLPEVGDYRRAFAAPSQPCSHCGRFLPLVEDMTIRVGALEWTVYRCRDCKTAPPQLGQPKVLPPAPKKVEKQATLLPVGPSADPMTVAAASEVKSPGKPKLGFQRPSLPPPTAAPEGLPPLWTGPIPSGTNYYDEAGLRPSVVATRLEAFLMEHGWSHCFTTDQLRDVAVGGTVGPKSPKYLSKRWNRGQKDLKENLAAKGIALGIRKRDGGKLRFFWLERTPTTGAEAAAAAT